MFEQAAFPVQNEAAFAPLMSRMEAAFVASRVDLFLASVEARKLRVRQVEEIMAAGLLGEGASDLYGALPVSDQALFRERYLAHVERVSPDLRQRFLKVYAYY